MAGRHEPASKGSFYLSLATAALRGALVIAAVVLGIFVLSRAFPSEGEPDLAEPPPPTATTPAEPQDEETPPEEPPEEPPASPRVMGVAVKVLNGTNETGLARTVSDELAGLGYRVREPGNATQNYDQTALFFAKGWKLEAQHLRDTRFPGASIERNVEEQDPDPRIRIVVVLGLDYLQSE